ncbi:hypothetical protein R3P38DRAFT_3179646 [Favolaschia claudopus]|uniref:Uncharacterized protein n=1 Tax=Favolaschia claudopus TaxID=2862362 RepID=A0AAW0CQG7_9AGAR
MTDFSVSSLPPPQFFWAMATILPNPFIGPGRLTPHSTASQTQNTTVPYDIWEHTLHNFLLDDYGDRDAIFKAVLTCQAFKAIIQPKIFDHVNLRSQACAILFFRTVVEAPHLASRVKTLQLSFDFDVVSDSCELYVDEFPGGEPYSDSDEPLSELDTEGYEELGPGLLNARRQRDRDDSKIYADEKAAKKLVASATRPTPFSGTPVLCAVEDEPKPIRAFWRSFCSGMPVLSSLTTLSISYNHDDCLFLQRFNRYGDVANTLPPSLRTLHFPLGPDWAIHMA